MGNYLNLMGSFKHEIESFLQYSVLLLSGQLVCFSQDVTLTDGMSNQWVAFGFTEFSRVRSLIHAGFQELFTEEYFRICYLKILRQDNYLKILLQFFSCFNVFYPVLVLLLVSTIWKSKLLWRYLWFLVGLTIAREKIAYSIHLGFALFYYR